MKRIEYMITGLCWVVWLAAYVALAAWVLQDVESNAPIRLLTIGIGLVWALVGSIIIDDGQVPQSITKALFEDEGR